MNTILQDKLEELLQKQMRIADKSELEKWKESSYLMDMRTVSQFWNYVQSAPAIIIVGDYDVDGVCASAIMAKGIKEVLPEIKINIRIPKRLSEGYGFNENIANEIREKLPQGSLVITVDNGIAAAESLERLKADGYPVIVTDHHELGNRKIPEVDMLIDPKVKGKELLFQGDYWCGAGVAYKLVESVVSKELKEELEVYAAIATISDCMPLREGNWGLVKNGLSLIRSEKIPFSIHSLLLGMNQSPINAIEDTIGFYIGPAINAPGRLYDDGAKQSLDYLLNPTLEKRDKLIQTNNERKELRDNQFKIIEKIIEENHMENDCPIWIQAEGLHEGIIGILAGMITEKYKVPAIVLTESHKDTTVLKGSARSIGDADIFEYLQEMESLYVKEGTKGYFAKNKTEAYNLRYKNALDEMRINGYSCLGKTKQEIDKDVEEYIKTTPNQQLFVGYGGHKGAAGLSIKKDNFRLVRSRQIAKPSIEVNNITLDIRKQDIPDMAIVCETFRPFGEGNLQPKFNVEVNLIHEKADMIGKPPLHLCIEDPLKKYKILHFYHEPNELANKNVFALTGAINFNIFRNKQSAVLTADEALDTICKAGEQKNIYNTNSIPPISDIDY